MTTWGDTLIEWCNCLQLSPKLKDLNELRESDFFQNILSILNKSETLDKIDQPFFQILTLLKETYQYAQIEGNNCDSFTDLPEDKFLIITSLLLHYTCIHDGREQFTLPLCQNLPKNLQLSIKDFLEKVHKDVTYSDLEKLIVQERVYEYVESKPTRPLTAVFRTPSLKRKYSFEKDRTVNKLKTALELEQYEKADVEDELKLQIKKTQKLEKLLSKSNDEISTLKSEIFKLKCQTPPQCSKKHDSDHKMRLMRKELENFEQYIENSEKEHEKLREEHHLYKKKIEEYEVEYANLRSQHLAYEEQIDELGKLLQERSAKVAHLETYCKELNEILEGFRQKQPESTENSFSDFVQQTRMNSSFLSQEDLASAVIEIQLKEAHEQIENLNCRIATGEDINKESMNKIDILEKQLNDTLSKQSELEKQLICEKEKYVQEIQQFEDKLKQSKEENQQISQTILVLQESLDNLNLERNNQSTEIENQGTKILELENVISTLKTETEKWSLDFVSKNQELEEATNKLDDSLLRLKEYADFKQNIKQQVQGLKVFHNKEFEEYTNLIEKLKESVLLYETTLAQFEERQKKLCTELKEKNNLNSSLMVDLENFKEEINKINEDWIEDKKQNENKLKALTESENNLIREKERCIKEIQQIKDERDDFSNELRVSQRKINELSNKISVLEESLENLSSEKNDHLTKLEQQSNKITELENVISKFKTETDKLSSDLVSKNKEFEDLTIRYEKSQRKLEEYSGFEQHMKQHVVDFKVFHKKEFNEYTNLISKLKGSIELYDNKLTKSEQLREKLHIDLHEKNELNSSLLSDLERLKEEIKIINENWNEDRKQKDDMLEKLVRLEDDLSSSKQKYVQEIEEIKKERNILHSALEISEKKKEEISDENVKLQNTIESLNSKESDQQKELEKQSVKLVELQNIISESKIETEKCNLELISKIEELKDLITKHNILQKKLKEHNEFQQSIKEKITNLKAFHNKEYQEYVALIAKLKDSLGLYENKLQLYEDQNQNLLIELNDTKKLNSSLLMDQKNLKEEINRITSEWNEDRKQKENLLEELSQLEIEKTNEKEKFILELEKIENDRNNLSNELDISDAEKKDILNKLIILQEKIDHLNSEGDNKLAKMGEDSAKISELENVISNLKTNLDLANSNLISKNSELEETVAKHEHSIKKLEKYVSFEKYMKQQIIDLQSFHKKEMYECNTLLTNLKESLSIYDKKLTESEEQRNKLVAELDDVQNSKTSLSLDMNKLKEEMNVITSDWCADKKQIEKIKNENETLKDNFIGLTKTIKLFNDELNKIVRSLKERKNKSNKILNKMQMSYNEINTSDLLKTPEKNSKPNDVSSEINILGEQISKLNVYIDIFSEKETFYLKELEGLKEELTVSNDNRFDVIQTLKEQILENEHQISSQTESLHSLVEKYNQLEMENQEYLKRIEKHAVEISRLKESHSDEIILKDQNIATLKEKIQVLEEANNDLKSVHTKKIEELLEKIIALQDQSSKDIEEIGKYKTKIVSLEAQIAIFKEEISQVKNKTCLTEEEYETNLANLQVQVVRSKLEITELKKKNEELDNEKEILLAKFNVLETEKDQEIQEKKILESQLTETNRINSELKDENISLKKELEPLKELQHRCNQFEQEKTNKRFLEEKQVELSQKIDTLMRSNEMQKETYEVFKIYYKKFKDDLDKLLTQKNSLENLTNNLRTQMISLNKYISGENSKKYIERKEALDIISEDIMKHYNRYSKQINDIVQELVRYYEKNCDNIFSSLEVKIEDCLEKYNIPELTYQLSDLTERAVDILEQTKVIQRELENSCKEEDEKIQQKENILTTSRKINVEKMKEDDLKKKNVTLRQKITLLENTKSNLEKTVKKLREENKKLKENDNRDGIDNDVHYKILLQEYIAYKEDQERVLKEYKMQLVDLQKEYEDHKDNCMRTSTPIGDVFFSQPETDKKLETELEKLQIAFSNVRITNEKLENENMILKRIASEHKDEMGKFTSIKEAYDKLLEENNKLMTEVDTVKYKRARDRDEFLRWLKKERHENESKNTKMIQNIKAEYETKLEKMKDKMIKLYREEVNKEMSKIKGKQHESTSLVKTVEQLECDLFEAKQKIQLLMERDTQNRNRDSNILPQMHGSNSQLHELDTLSLKDFPLSCMNSTAIDYKPKTSIAKFMEFKHPNKVNPSSLDTRRQYEERQVKTLPRSGTVVEEVNIRRKTSFGVPNSIGNLQMEDEEEVFNNKCLTDLKQGKCELPAAEGRDSRVSELAWRNSLVPPHLKSSYPAETQFCSPERFREDDIKCGGGTFDDSSSKLLPNEKRKKDFGTTSYKKPGPPTPSKNGGRLSLTGSDIHVTKEQHPESKKNTPGRIRSLFSGRSSSRNSTEPGASPKKRLSIFRK